MEPKESIHMWQIHKDAMDIKSIFDSFFLKLFLKTVFENIKNTIVMFSV